MERQARGLGGSGAQTGHRRRQVTMVTEKLVDVQVSGPPSPPHPQPQRTHADVENPNNHRGGLQEVFRRLDPQEMGRLLSPQLPMLALGVAQDSLHPWPVAFAEARLRDGALPAHLAAAADGVQHRFVAGFTQALQGSINRVLDLKELVVTSMVADKQLIVAMFQKCGEKELAFLVDSGLWFGFLLGVLQMGVWMFYDSPWTLTVGGAVVGYLTNWIALKCIFEPVEPTRFGPFILQGMFLRRQKEVSAEFADFFVDRVLTSQRMWETMVTGAPPARPAPSLTTWAEWRPLCARGGRHQGWRVPLAAPGVRVRRVRPRRGGGPAGSRHRDPAYRRCRGRRRHRRLRCGLRSRRGARPAAPSRGHDVKLLHSLGLSFCRPVRWL